MWSNIRYVWTKEEKLNGLLSTATESFPPPTHVFVFLLLALLKEKGIKRPDCHHWTVKCLWTFIFLGKGIKSWPSSNSQTRITILLRDRRLGQGLVHYLDITSTSSLTGKYILTYITTGRNAKRIHNETTMDLHSRRLLRSVQQLIEMLLLPRKDVSTAEPPIVVLIEILSRLFYLCFY
jgi:hypothetical protein